MFKRTCLYLGVLLATTSCGDNTTKIIKSMHTLVSLQEADTAQCPYGGTVILSGVDLSENGVLEPEEVTQTQVVCNGNESDSTLVLVSDEPAGENCADGGSKVETGIDDDRDGTLDAEEIDAVQYICDGTDGQTSLMRSETEPAGENCPEGGVKLSHGLDADGNGVLGDEEVQGVEYVCDGRPGTGMNSLVSIMDEAPGTNCEHGGYGLRSGLDLNGDHLLQPSEVENTVYVCDAADGFSSLIRREDEPAGGNCPFGGQAVMSGQDTDFNGYLDDMEVQNTSYVCHGADGIDGIDGVDGINNLFETTVEPAGTTCAAGGVWVISGPDTNRNDLLDASEIQVEQVICNGEDGTDGADGEDGYGSLVLVTMESAGVNCTIGGQKIETGVDLDRDGVLDAGEVTQTQYVCQGADGADGLQSLLKITAETPGLNCATGGSRVESGLDANANDVLDVAEVQQTQFVCNGADGFDGGDGVDGADGLNSLVRVTAEAAGLNCTAGGTKIETGLDADADGILDVGEVLQTQYVCNGIAGVDGCDGTDGANGLNSLVRVTAEAAGLNCMAGGTKIETGLDADSDGVLDPSEIAQTRYICNGADGSDGTNGSDGFNSLVTVFVVAPGVPCAAGGQRIEIGLDLDRDGVLDAGEVTQTQYVCNGAAGANGSDGSDGIDGTDGLASLVRVTTEPAGVQCTNGGSFVETGLDLDSDGVLDAGEITQSQYICNGVDGTAGLDGADGLAGINSLVRLTVEPVGSNCASGGSKVESGLDTDGDDTLDAGEVTQTQYVCNGAAGADGTDGSDGTDGTDGSNGLNSLVRITPEAMGANCTAGGNLIESGLDLNANGVLDVGEVTSSRYVCNGTDGSDGSDGSDGADGSDMLLRATNAAWGGVCTFGGVKLETGVDGNGNGVLDDPEVTRTQYVCNRTASFVSIHAGESLTCGLLASGRVKCWGGAISALTEITEDGRVISISDVSQMAVGTYHMCAVKTDGSAWCWGNNGNGQLGNGTTVTGGPVQVSGFASGISSVACGNSHSCAVKTDGSAWCWGYNNSGQLGDNTNTQRLVPTQVTGMTSGGSYLTGGNAHTCILKSDGSVWCWGNNATGTIGDTTYANRLVPTQVSGLTSGVEQLSSGYAHNCIVKTDGSAWCWGANFGSQLGDGTTANRPAPVQVNGMTTGVSKTTGGYNFSCAVKTDGSAWCWGFNSLGQLGDGTTTQRMAPTQVIGLNSGVYQIVGNVTASGSPHTCAVKTDGTAWCWGNNSSGQLGDGTNSNRNSPSQVLFANDLAP